MSANVGTLGVNETRRTYVDHSAKLARQRTGEERGGRPYLLGDRHVHKNMTTPLSEAQRAECADALHSSTLFRFCSEESIRRVIDNMRREEFGEGKVLIEQGEPQSRVYLIVQGTVQRLRYLNEKLHQVETVGSGSHRGMFGALHVLKEEPTYATALTETDGVAYTLDSAKLNQLLENDTTLAKEVIYSLSKEVFQMSRLRTPLFDQDPKPNSLLGTTLGAVIESYYRSGLNAWLNAQLTGRPMANMFPMFHIQIPTRVLYINGFKTVRSVMNDRVHATDYPYPGAVRLGAALVPGLAMTPVSSILEACNAESNPEPLYKRWMRGLGPRTLREIIFGIGINQLSDACEERLPIENGFGRTAAGSMIAGVAAGYLSHIPHNISTMKLLEPHLTYRQIVKGMIDQNIARTPHEWVPGARRALARVLTFVLPKGCLIRTAQICGSFMIINGTIHLCASSITGAPLQADSPPKKLSRR